ncbi:hypothetical protein A5751_23115 [Mycolicibacterium fortuitum]|nr:hypothetical protein A5751_23115 [Mycolicibacterium fortuitum]
MEPQRLGARPTIMRTIRMIDAELRVLAAIRAACRRAGDRPPNTARIDGLLDERLQLACLPTDRPGDSVRVTSVTRGT